MITMHFAFQEWPYRQTFRFARETRDNSRLFVVYLSDGVHVGRGECGLQSLKNETVEGVSATLASIRENLSSLESRGGMNATVPASSARNAVDCAFWDLEAKRTGKSVWEIAGIFRKERIEVDLTIGLNDTEKMRSDAEAAIARGYRTLKVKADAHSSIGLVEAIHAAAPNARLIVDANEAWTLSDLKNIAPRLKELNVCLIEQPLHHERDRELEDYDCPIPLCADESCATREGLDALERRYDAINVKLDKTGGLTEALALARQAKSRGLRIIVGCNGATSLGIAPAYMIGTMSDWCDLDSPALLIDDRAFAMHYEEGMLRAFDRGLWG